LFRIIAKSNGINIIPLHYPTTTTNKCPWLTTLFVYLVQGLQIGFADIIRMEWSANYFCQRL